ncbi:hypothetical protein BCR43DRAFT_204913 [Syncephalastrum racemosum]|uniref:Uncharacterized protein n=1 Tax=Syncephalastrum racemosum TaxID=13706 RepID=A0A1X2HI44_SYNRA|nr:hypothetical protein BCR43DRAFT_204913 [Syncephalastrum racemosum]
MYPFAFSPSLRFSISYLAFCACMCVLWLCGVPYFVMMMIHLLPVTFFFTFFSSLSCFTIFCPPSLSFSFSFSSFSLSRLDYVPALFFTFIPFPSLRCSICHNSVWICCRIWMVRRHQSRRVDCLTRRLRSR